MFVSLLVLRPIHTKRNMKLKRKESLTVFTFLSSFYRPQTKFAKVMFLQVSVILSTGGGGACVVAPRGGMRGWSRGGHAWLFQGGCMVAPGGHA